VSSFLPEVVAKYGNCWPPVTIASVCAHGVRQLLVYCLGKREGRLPALVSNMKDRLSTVTSNDPGSGGSEGGSLGRLSR
jgi:hypothetical protein